MHRSPSRTIALAALALTLVLAGVATAGEQSRPEYVAQLERICKPGSDATKRAVQGVRQDVRAERLLLAGAKFAHARRIFARTVEAISKVPRPAADAETLERWFVALDREKVFLGRVVESLRAEDVARFQRVLADFIRQGNKANNVVVSFGFNYCAFKPSRLQ